MVTLLLLVPTEVYLSFMSVIACNLQTELAVAFISNNFPLVYPAKESQNVGFVKYSAEK